MTREELLVMQENYTVPYESTDDCLGYKSTKKWEDMDDDEIIYIPTDAYTIAASGLPRNHIDKIEDAFSKADFIKLCDGDEYKAKQVFIFAEGHYPEDTMYEWEDEDEETFEIEGRIYERGDLCIGIEYMSPYGIALKKCNVEDIMEAITELQNKHYPILRTHFDTKIGEPIGKGVTFIDE